MKFIGSLALCALTAATFVSCNDDENPDVPTLEPDGTQIVSIGNYNFYYDSKDRVEKVMNLSTKEEVKIDYGDGTITFSGFDDETDNTPMDVDFNLKGYITGISGTWDYVDTEDGDRDKGGVRSTFSYDGDGHLISIKTETNGTETEDGYSSTYSGSETYDLTWQGGNLIKVTENDVYNEGSYTEKSVTEFDITYGTEVNKYNQTPWSLTETFSGDGVLQALAAAGLFGKGTEQLPTRIDETEDGLSEGAWTVSFTLNANGSIATETFRSNTYKYKYQAK